MGTNPLRLLRDSIMTPHVLCVGGEDHHFRIPLLLGLRDCGFSVSAAGTGSGDAFLRSQIPYHLYKYSRFGDPFGDITAVNRLRRLLIEAKPQIVQSFDTKPNILVPLAARGVRTHVVRTINGMGWVYSSRSPLGLAARPLYRGLQKVASTSSAATVFQNSEDLAFFERHRLTGRTTARLIASSGIDIDRFAESRARGPSRTALRLQLDLEGREVVMTVTRLTTQKGIPTLLRAAELVHRIRPSVRFVLVGPRQSEGPFAVSAAELDWHAPYVVAIGSRDDVPSLLSTADVFAFPSEYREGVPRVLLEAGLAGLPIVTSQMPGCTDVVRDEWNGYVVPPRSPELLAEKIVALLDNRELANAMGHRSIGFVKDNFALDNVLAQYDELYRNLLKRRSSASLTVSSKLLAGWEANRLSQFANRSAVLDPASHRRQRDVP
jgi:glycosyltransferase involved in cell wall biosynthesis